LSGERARLFVALELPGPVRDRLASWRGIALEDGPEGVRSVRREDLHVTLCFLGSRDHAALEPIRAACRVVHGRGSVELAPGEAVLLPRRRPRVLAVALTDVDRGLEAVQTSLSEALHAGGFYEPEPRPFFGHVTVARAGRGARIPRSALLAPAPDPVRFTGSTIVLYRSQLRRGGARYEPLERIAL
jgi:2'-5' RNA ligase